MKKVFVLNGHPIEGSFNDALAESFLKGLKETTCEVRYVKIRDLKFDPILKDLKQEQEPDLKVQQENISWCDHLVIFTPMWWLGVPALLKGYFDRVLQPGFAYKYHKGQLSPLPEQLLKGRSAQVFNTQDSNKWLIKFFVGDSFWKTLKIGTLGFCGFAPVKRTIFHKVRKVGDDGRRKYLDIAYSEGKKLR